jgi:hypothetical protein
MAQMYSSQTVTAGALVPTTVSGYNTWTFANARSGHRLKFIYNGGVSGERGDQMIARLPTLLALKPGHMILECFVNAPGPAVAGYTTVVQSGWPSRWPALPNQGVAVTLANVAAVEFSFAQYAIDRFFRMGGQVVSLNLDRCAENYTAAQIATGIEYNRLCRDAYEGDARVNLIDDWAASHDPTASTTTTIRMKSGYMQESVGSGTHDSNKGAYYLSVARAAYIQANWPAVSFLPSDVTEIPSISLRNLLANPLFVTTGGTNGAGSTGTPPGSWTALRSGGSGTQSVAASVNAAPANGAPGSECVLACTMSAAGDLIRLQQDPAIGNINIGDIIEGVGAAVIDAGVAIAGCYIELQYNDGTTTFILRDLIPLNNIALGTEGYYVTFRTPAYQIQTKGAGAFISYRFIVQASGANAPTIRAQQCQVVKRNSF